MTGSTPSGNETLLSILIRDFRSLVLECRRDGMSWNEISAASGLPVYVCRVIAGETVGNRPSMDRQSGR